MRTLSKQDLEYWWSQTNHIQMGIICKNPLRKEMSEKEEEKWYADCDDYWATLSYKEKIAAYNNKEVMIYEN